MFVSFRFSCFMHLASGSCWRRRIVSVCSLFCQIDSLSPDCRRPFACNPIIASEAAFSVFDLRFAKLIKLPFDCHLSSVPAFACSPLVCDTSTTLVLLLLLLMSSNLAHWPRPTMVSSSRKATIMVNMYAPFCRLMLLIERRMRFVACHNGHFSQKETTLFYLIQGRLFFQFK